MRGTNAVEEAVLAGLSLPGPAGVGSFDTPGSTGLVCAAVSGGVDSMSLLYALRAVSARAGVDIAAVHVNHHTRPESDDDQRLVTETCRALGVPCLVRHVHAQSVPAQARRGPEADLRRLRYGAIAAAASAAGARRVLLAHHADDQLETLLWRIARGTGTRGAGGMRACTEWAGIAWVRPLLSLEKRDLYAYAAERQVTFTEDASNRSERFLRNALRAQVIPPLKAIAPHITRTAGTFCQVLQEEDLWLDREARQLLGACAKWTRAWAEVELVRFRTAPRPLQRRVIHILLYCLGCDPVSFAQVEQVLRTAFSDSPSSERTLHHHCSVRREYDLLRLERQAPGGVRTDPSYALSWSLSAASVLDLARTPPFWSWRFTCDEWKPADPLPSPSPFELHIPRTDRLEVRSPLAGDRIGLVPGGHKKLQDVFVDAKVPRHLRGAWPVIGIDQEVIWVPGLRRSGSHLLTGEEDGYVIRAYPYSTAGEWSLPLG